MVSSELILPLFHKSPACCRARALVELTIMSAAVWRSPRSPPASFQKSRGLDEDAAYHALRKLAMERGRPLVAIARDVIAMADLLL